MTCDAACVPADVCTVLNTVERPEDGETLVCESVCESGESGASGTYSEGHGRVGMLVAVHGSVRAESEVGDLGTCLSASA